jgi:hypothetical protein
MPNLRLADLTAEIEANVRRALLEDVGSGWPKPPSSPATTLSSPVQPGWTQCSGNWTRV